MEDQGKRLLLAVAVAFGIMMLWSVLFPPSKEEPKKDTPQVTQTEQRDGGATAPTPSGGAIKPRPPGGATTAEAPATEPTPKPAAAQCPEALTAFEYDTFRAIFSNCDGALKSFELMGEKFENRKAKRPIQLGPDNAEKGYYGFTIGFGDAIPAGAAWKVLRKEPNKVIYGWSGNGISVEKAFTLFPDDFLVQLKVSIEQSSAGETKRALSITQYGYQDPNASTGGGWTRVSTAWKSACFMGDEVRTQSAGSLRKREKLRTGNVRWAGFTHSYFLAAISPKPDKDTELACNGYAVANQPGVMRTDLVYPVVNMKQGDVFGRVMTAYYGPKYIEKLGRIDDVVGYSTHFDEAIDLGWFSFIARPLLWLLQWFQSFVVNWGIAIILLTIVVKLATLYWTNKSMRSMKAMSKLQPKVKELQAKYKDDRQRQQTEIMSLYKTHGVSPLAGCLPMLLQMPIWFALYRALMAAAELYQAPFIPGWIDDLTATDPYYVLPVLLMGTMFLQSKLSPTTADSAQQKIMMYGMPLMFGFFSFFFPSGLTLYILTNTLLSLLHHLWLHKTDADAAVAVAVKDESTGEKKKAVRTSGRKAAKAGEKDEAESEASADELEADNEPDDETGERPSTQTASKPQVPRKRSKRGGRSGRRGGKRKRNARS